MYQVNLNLAAVFQDAANVPGVKAFPIEGIVLLLGFLVASGMLLIPLRRARVDRDTG